MNSDVKKDEMDFGHVLSNYEALSPDCHWPPEHLRKKIKSSIATGGIVAVTFSRLVVPILGTAVTHIAMGFAVFWFPLRSR